MMAFQVGEMYVGTATLSPRIKRVFTVAGRAEGDAVLFIDDRRNYRVTVETVGGREIARIPCHDNLDYTASAAAPYNGGKI